MLYDDYEQPNSLQLLIAYLAAYYGLEQQEDGYFEKVEYEEFVLE